MLDDDQVLQEQCYRFYFDIFPKLRPEIATKAVSNVIKIYENDQQVDLLVEWSLLRRDDWPKQFATTIYKKTRSAGYRNSTRQQLFPNRRRKTGFGRPENVLNAPLMRVKILSDIADLGKYGEPALDWLDTVGEGDSLQKQFAAEAAATIRKAVAKDD